MAQACLPLAQHTLAAIQTPQLKKQCRIRIQALQPNRAQPAQVRLRLAHHKTHPAHLIALSQAHNLVLHQRHKSGGQAGSQSAIAQSSGYEGFDAIEDDELVIDTESLADGDGLGSIQVQWQISNDGSNWGVLPGAIQSSFTPRDSEVGKFLRVQVSYVDGQGNTEILTSPPSKAVQNINDQAESARS